MHLSLCFSIAGLRAGDIPYHIRGSCSVVDDNKRRYHTRLIYERTEFEMRKTMVLGIRMSLHHNGRVSEAGETAIVKGVLDNTFFRRLE